MLAAGKDYSAYRERNAVLKEMGFSGYQAYLKSPLWKSIRLRVLERDRYKCRGCQANATQVHHRQYNLAVLSGKSIGTMTSICNSCHNNIEYSRSGVKSTLKKANRALSSKARRLKGPSPQTIAKQQHEAYRAKVARIKNTMRGRSRTIALADALRERTAEMGGGCKISPQNQAQTATR